MRLVALKNRSRVPPRPRVCGVAKGLGFFSPLQKLSFSTESATSGHPLLHFALTTDRHPARPLDAKIIDLPSAN